MVCSVEQVGWDGVTGHEFHNLVLTQMVVKIHEGLRKNQAMRSSQRCVKWNYKLLRL